MYQKTNASWIKHWDFELFDIVCMEVSFFLSYILRHGGIVKDTVYIYLRMGLILGLLDIIVVLLTKNYKGILMRTKWQEIIAVFKHVTIVQLLFLLYEYSMKEAEVLSRIVFGLNWVFSIALCFMVRCIWKKVIRKHIITQKQQRKMLIISSKSKIDFCLKEIQKKEYREFEVSCIAFLEERVEYDSKIPVLCGKAALLEYLRQEVVDEVMIDFFREEKELHELIELFLCMGITVHVGMSFLPEDLPNHFIEKMGGYHVITTSVKTAESWELACKRLMDIIGGLVGLVLTGIAYLFVAPAIKIASPGPVFFKQQRVGKNGRIFNIYKFRSMYLNAEERKKELMDYNEMQGLMFKMENDPRIIGSEKGPGKGIGNFIRKTSIDELPQFWNILKGDMSLVGTRPPTVNEFEQYDFHHKIRLSIKPGLTGMWQVSGRSEITDFEEIVRLDTKYIENWSLGLDIKLILKTIKVVLDRKGSK